MFLCVLVSTKYIQGFQISVVEIGDGNGIQFCYHFDMKNATWKDGVDYNLKVIIQHIKTFPFTFNIVNKYKLRN